MDWKEYYQIRKKNVRDAVDMAKVMSDYGVKFPRSIKSTTAISCPFHGRDNRPSAQYYPDTQSFYCFYCGKAWDVFSFVMQAENAKFTQALAILERKYGIARPQFDGGNKDDSLESDLEAVWEGKLAPDGKDVDREMDAARDAIEALERLIIANRDSLPEEAFCRVAWALDNMDHELFAGIAPPPRIVKDVATLRGKVMSCLP